MKEVSRNENNGDTENSAHTDIITIEPTKGVIQKIRIGKFGNFPSTYEYIIVTRRRKSRTIINDELDELVE